MFDRVCILRDLLMMIFAQPSLKSNLPNEALHTLYVYITSNSVYILYTMHLSSLGICHILIINENFSQIYGTPFFSPTFLRQNLVQEIMSRRFTGSIIKKDNLKFHLVFWRIEILEFDLVRNF